MKIHSAPKEWLADDRVGLLTAAARGVWVELEAYFETFEVVELDGDMAEIANALRAQVSELKYGLTQLKKIGVYQVRWRGKGDHLVRIVDAQRKKQLEAEAEISDRFTSLARMPEKTGRNKKNYEPQKRQLSFLDTGGAGAETSREQKGMPTESVLAKNISATAINLVVAEWNMIPGINRCTSVTKKRRELLRARLQEQYFVDHWRAAIERLHEIQWVKGKVSIEWFLRPDQVVRIVEGAAEDWDKQPATEIEQMLGVIRNE